MDLVDCFDPTLFAGDYYVDETYGGTMSATMEHTDWDWFTEAVQPNIESFSTTDTEWVMEEEPPTNNHNRSYMCYPFIEKNHLEAGNKIMLPPSVLDELVYREFTADEGVVFMPKWMMENMKLQDGEVVNIENTSLLQGTYIKLQPHATKFTTLSDHKSLLEKAFKDFACLTPGDTIVINHDDEKYLIDIVETKPSSHAIALFDTDCEVDFATPLDYKEPEKNKVFTRDGESVEEFMKNLGIKESNVAKKQQTEFMGQTRRVNGKVVAAATKVKENDRSKDSVWRPVAKRAGTGTGQNGHRAKTGTSENGHGWDKWLSDESYLFSDCEVDFATPLDYKEPEKNKVFTRDGESVEEFMKNLGIKESNVAKKQQTEFMGQTRRVNGKVVAAATKVKENDRSKVQLKKEPEEFKAFSGKSFRLI
nr:hypothetical protein [Tanacetum cinerariifolium]